MNGGAVAFYQGRIDIDQPFVFTGRTDTEAVFHNEDVESGITTNKVFREMDDFQTVSSVYREVVYLLSRLTFKR